MGGSPTMLLTDSDVDALASEFLQSRYLGPIYADWSPTGASTRSCGAATCLASPTTAIWPIPCWNASWPTWAAHPGWHGADRSARSGMLAQRRSSRRSSEGR